jgi:hypothetical protein
MALRAISVADYGPLGTANDSATINAALAAASGRRLVFPPNATLNTGQNVLNNASDVVIDGNGCTLQLIGTGARIAAINVTGTCRNVEIRNLRVKGTAVVADRHAGILSSGANLTNVRVVNCTVEDVTLGISFAADGAGSINGVLYEGNRVKNVVGTASGDGYGLHVAISDTVNPSGIRMIGNVVESAQRHSIYCGKANGAVISNNQLLNHRDANKDSTIRSALMVARSTNVSVTGNVIQRPAGGGIMLSGSVGTTVAGPYEVVGNVVSDPQDGCALVYFGQQDPVTEGFPTHVDFSHNIMFSTALVGAVPPPLMTVWNGKFLRIRENIFRLPTGATGTGMVLQGIGVTGNDYMDQIEVSENVFDVDTNTCIRISPGHETDTTAYRFRGNRRIGAGNLFTISANITNPNIDIQDQSRGGLVFTGVSTAKPFMGAPVQTTAPVAGAAAALPASPKGYMTVNLNNADVLIPYY